MSLFIYFYKFMHLNRDQMSERFRFLKNNDKQNKLEFSFIKKYRLNVS